MIYWGLVIFPFVMLVAFLVALCYAIHVDRRNRYLTEQLRRATGLLKDYMDEERARLFDQLDRGVC